MEFGEFMGLAVSLLVTFVLFPTVLFNGIAKARRAKGATGDALRMSELKGMIDAAVAGETAALRARIEVLEEIATSRHDDFGLVEAPPAPRLALPEEDAEPGSARRARVRA